MASFSDSSNDSINLTDITGSAITVAAKRTYRFQFLIPFSTAAVTTGIGLAVNCPASANYLTYQVRIPFAADGSDSEFVGSGTASDDVVLSTGVAVANTVYLAEITGILSNGANAGMLKARFRSEVSGSAVTVKGSAIAGYRLTPLN